MESIKSKADELLKAYEDAKLTGDKDLIKKTGKEYGQFLRQQTYMNKRYKSMLDTTTTKLANVNEIALSYLNDEMPSVYATNYNQVSKDMPAGISFDLVDETTVKNLVKDNPKLLPNKKLDIPKDKRWNQKAINAQVLQSIIQGESIDKMAKRLTPIMDRNKTSAIRNARTMTTSAQNKGRLDSYKAAQDNGVVLHKVWMATNSERTRAWHAALNGVEVEIDQPFENDYGKIMFPGDPDANPGNVYNCRCTLTTKIIGFKREDGSIKYIEGEENELKNVSKRDQQKKIDYAIHRDEFKELQSKSYAETTEWFDANSNYSDWAEKMFDTEYDDVIDKYSGEYYANVNNYLRTNNFVAPNRWFDESDMSAFIDQLDESIESFDLKKSIRVYRSSSSEFFGKDNMTYEELASNIGRVYNDKAYLSTSTLKSLPGEQTVGGNLKYEINIPKGANQGAYIAKYSENQQEREFLLARNRNYKLIDVRKDASGTVTVELDLVDRLKYEEQRALVNYKSFNYYPINEKLRNNETLTDFEKTAIKELDSALEKLPNYDGDLSRSLYFNSDEELAEYVNSVSSKKTMKSNTYTSTTKDTEPYNDLGQVQIYYKNTKYGRDLEGYDNGELEVLYERNAKFDIESQGWNDNVYEIHVKEHRNENNTKQQR